MSKAGHHSQPTNATNALTPTSIDMRWGCTLATVCTLVMASCTLVTYSGLFSDQFQLLWKPAWSLYTIPTAHAAASSSPVELTDLSHIVFALAGSAQSWEKRRAYAELWWHPNQTRGHVWMDTAPSGPWPNKDPPYRVSRDASRYGKAAPASRIANIVVEAYELVSLEPGKDKVRWFVMGDDDTVFFPENLVTVLQKYNHEQMYYVGMPSETVGQDIALHAYGMAFGGGGFAISYPAAAELAKVMGACLDKYASFYGSDQRVHACLVELGIPLTREPGFHQVDIKEDVYGMLAAHPLAPLVSLHHLDYMKPIIPNKPSQQEALQSLFSAYEADPARILQQAFCYDRGAGAESVLSVSVSWGYTVQVYPEELVANELETALLTFKSVQNNDGPFIFNTRPFPTNPCAGPFIFLLESVLHNQTDVTLTQYTRNKTADDQALAEGKANCDKQGFSVASRIEKVKVFATKMDPSLWKQAPRRHCCKTQMIELGTMLEVQIKSCSPGESKTVPIST
ncbi:hypothetical protein LUZ61_003958 [Rhynchospora tenuis]|uniref:Uncharacterized protein n=1 Tax=Rhynchospora tenuis TaxID=198213 RepID=A0AAD5ZLW9_9POAL|nr:hypothetical protein LUZ61_003958 [Rhynchospora tenuis]